MTKPNQKDNRAEVPIAKVDLGTLRAALNGVLKLHDADLDEQGVTGALGMLKDYIAELLKQFKRPSVTEGSKVRWSMVLKSLAVVIEKLSKLLRCL